MDDLQGKVSLKRQRTDKEGDVDVKTGTEVLAAADDGILLVETTKEGKTAATDGVASTTVCTSTVTAASTTAGAALPPPPPPPNYYVQAVVETEDGVILPAFGFWKLPDNHAVAAVAWPSDILDVYKGLMKVHASSTPFRNFSIIASDCGLHADFDDDTDCIRNLDSLVEPCGWQKVQAREPICGHVLLLSIWDGE